MGWETTTRVTLALCNHIDSLLFVIIQEHLLGVMVFKHKKTKKLCVCVWGGGGGGGGSSVGNLIA